MKQQAIDKFWKYVDGTDDPAACWTWTGPKSPGVTYGYFSYGRNQYRARQFAYFTMHGEFPKRRQQLLSSCDNPDCVNPAHLIPATTETHYWHNVIKAEGANECWDWRGPQMPAGYGVVSLGAGLVTNAHRVSYELHHGPIPDGFLVRHKCDNPPCTNPLHLELGTTSDNVQDAIARGRWNYGPRPLGERAASAKLTTADVVQIRELYEAGGVTQRELGERYGVTHQTIGAILRRKKWKHV